MKLKQKKIAVITGVTSFLGRNVAKVLIANGFLVYGIVRPKSKKIDSIKDIKKLNVIELDFDKYSLDEIESFGGKYVNASDITFFHFGWGATTDRNNFKAQMENIDYSMKVLSFAHVLGASRFIFAGSQAEYSDSPYGTAKREFGNVAAKYLVGSDMKFIHLRIFSIYGHDDRENSLIKILVSLTKQNKDIDLSSCNYPWNFLYIDDFANIMHKFIDMDVKSDIYDIASDDTRLLKDIVIECHDVLNGKNTLYFGRRPDSTESFAIPDIRKLKSVIGDFEFTKISEGIKKV